MNRKQEIACWVFGLFLAYALGGEGYLYLDEHIVWPSSIAVIGALVVYSLRDRKVIGGLEVLGAGLGLAVLLALAGNLHEIDQTLDSIASRVEDVASNVAR